MKYIKYRLHFKTAVHFGNTSLESAKMNITSDTLFSALFLEALAISEEKARWLHQSVSNGTIVLSDLFPYIDKVDYLPKPMKFIETQRKTGDSTVKKAFKKLKYIPFTKLEEFIAGEIDAKFEADQLKKLGSSRLKTSVSLKGNEESMPYHIGLYKFDDENKAGLYFVVGLKEEYEEDFFELLDALSFTGIGGKRSSGLGKFEVSSEEELDAHRFEGEFSEYMLLSTALPTKEELNGVLGEATYQVVKRGGFVYSDNYSADSEHAFMKKRDIYMFTAGSCFKRRFDGDIYDVSDGGNHPVYRCGKGLFIGM